MFSTSFGHNNATAVGDGLAGDASGRHLGWLIGTNGDLLVTKTYTSPRPRQPVLLEKPANLDVKTKLLYSDLCITARGASLCK